MTATRCPVIRLPPIQMPDLSRGSCVGHRDAFDDADRALGEEYGSDRNVDRNDHKPDVMRAKAICRGCDVKAECLEWAIGNYEWGVLGATTPSERKRLRRMR